VNFRQAFIGLAAALLTQAGASAQTVQGMPTSQIIESAPVSQPPQPFGNAAPQVQPLATQSAPQVETVRNLLEFSVRTIVISSEEPLPAVTGAQELTPLNLQMLEDIAIYSMNQPKLRWSFSGNSAWSYDDYTGSQSSRYSTFSIGMAVAAEYGTPDAPLDLSGQYAPGYDLSGGPNKASGIDQSLSVAAQWHPSERALLRATVNLREAPGTDYAGNRAEIVSANVDVLGTYTIDPNVSLGFEVSIQPQYFSTTGNADQEQLKVYGDSRVDPAFRAGLYLGGESISSSLARSESDLLTGVRLGWTPTQKFLADASLGLRYRFLSSGPQFDPDGTVSLTWSPLDRTKFSLQGYSQVQPGYQSSGGNPLTYGGSITASQLLMYSVLLNLGGGYEYSTYPNGGAADQTLDFLSLAVEWHPHDKWSIGAFGRLENRSIQSGASSSHVEVGVNLSIIP